MPDTSVWRGINENLWVMGKYYFSHEAYNQYPVVGVSQYQATQYCNWLEIQLNKEYRKWLPAGYKIEVDLPTQAEYVKAVHEYCENPVEKLTSLEIKVLFRLSHPLKLTRKLKTFTVNKS